MGLLFLCTSDQHKKTFFLRDNPLNIPTEFDSNWSSGFREVDKNVKVYGQRRQVTTIPLMTAFGSGGLKRIQQTADFN